MSEQATEKPLPNNVDAERAVLGSMMLDGGVIADVLAILRPEDFFLNAHKIAFGRMRELATDGKPLDLTLLSDTFRRHGELDAVGGYVYLAGLVEFVLYSGAAVQNAEIVREKAALRRIVKAADQMREAAMREVTEAAKIAGNGHELLFAVETETLATRAEPAATTVPKALEAVLERMELRRKGFKMGIPFHLDDVDTITGGLHVGELTCLAARPAVGKTLLAMEVVRQNAERGVGAGVFSLEMSATELLMRYFSAGTGVSHTRIQDGNISAVEFSAISAYASRLMELGIEIDESTNLSAAEIRLRAKAMKARNPKMELVVIDSLGLMNHGAHGGRGDANLAQRIGASMRSLKDMAKDKELGVSVLLIHHLSRGEREDSEPTLRNLRDSGEIEQWCHNIVFLHPDGEMNNGCRRTLFIAEKQRGRGKQRAAITMDGNRQKFIPAEFFD